MLPATTELYTLSLHDALPIFPRCQSCPDPRLVATADISPPPRRPDIRPPPRNRYARDDGNRGGGEISAVATKRDRKSTRLNSSHPSISYAVFCLKKKKPKCDI